MSDVFADQHFSSSPFCVRPDVSAEQVLLHLSQVLRAGEAAAYELTESPGFNAGGLALAGSAGDGGGAGVGGAVD
ncbi:hypothetical protein [Pseudomonas sp. TE3610]